MKAVDLLKATLLPFIGTAALTLAPVSRAIAGEVIVGPWQSGVRDSAMASFFEALDDRLLQGGDAEAAASADGHQARGRALHPVAESSTLEVFGVKQHYWLAIGRGHHPTILAAATRMGVQWPDEVNVASTRALPNVWRTATPILPGRKPGRRGVTGELDWQIRQVFKRGDEDGFILRRDHAYTRDPSFLNWFFRSFPRLCARDNLRQLSSRVNRKLLEMKLRPLRQPFWH